MKNGFVPQAIAERTSYSRKVTTGELYGALVDGMRAVPVFAWNRRAAERPKHGLFKNSTWPHLSHSRT
jgi:hypothetical protein